MCVQMHSSMHQCTYISLFLFMYISIDCMPA